MAGRNHIPPNGLKSRTHHHLLDDPRLLHHQHRLSPPDLRLLEDRVTTQSREIQTLLHDNQRLAATHVTLKQEVVTSEQELRHLSSTAASVKAERDAQVREVYKRSLKLEEEARLIDGIPTELDRVRTEIQELRAERKELSEKLKDIDGDLARTHSELQQMPALKADIEAMYEEIQRGRAAIGYERKMHGKNFELSEAMEKHMILMAREIEKLRSELANAEKRAMAAAAAAVAAATPGPGYVAHYGNLEPGYGENSVSDPNAINQGSVVVNPQYGLGAGPHGPPGP